MIGRDRPLAFIRNPVLELDEAREILALPRDQRVQLGRLIRAIARHANIKAEECWRKRKGFQAAYWRVVSTYAKHIARAIERSDNQP
jgi:hypothetical protein